MNTEARNNDAELVTINEAPAKSSQLITLDPASYVVEVFAPFKDRLAAAVKAAKKEAAKIDIGTSAGLEAAKKLRATFREIRTGADAEKSARKRPIDAIGKLILSSYSELETEIKAHEEKYDKMVKDEEARKEAEKQAKLAAERARVEAIEARLASLRNTVQMHINSSSDILTGVIAELKNARLDPADYEEYLEDALTAVNTALDDLENLRVRALEREEEQRRQAAEKAELERLRAEKEERERKEEADKRQREEEEKKRKQEADEAAAAQARRIAELEAQLAAAQPKAPEPEAAVSYEPVQEQIKIGGVDVLVLSGETREVPISAPHVEPVPDPSGDRPSDDAIVAVLASHYGVDEHVVINWLRGFAK